MQQTKKRIVLYCGVAAVMVGLAVFSVFYTANQVQSAHSGEIANNINGQIVHQNNKPARLGATVHICGNACFEATPSILNGAFSISNIPPGHYAVYGEQKSCKSLEYTLNIAKGETIGIPFALQLDQCS